MRILLALLALLIAAAPAAAISRYNAWTMSCGEVKDRIYSEGAVILRFRSVRNPSLPLYDRFVADSSFCSSNEYARTSYVRTADTNSCPVRACEEFDIDNRLFFPRD